ncbi:anti-sigma factor family protein [Streptomyces boluensis]|uniref:Zinc-finger domain-containing protein n=1 Tax=Streptomyces boluensis TaxID=1775135 RepID=A0A964XJX8_9ACTN|nr:zf-HC2 domain-containing protein [Streptomyces boluensis]NBE51759.1 hypothetical protein [Streptomyces boluensis]
MTSTTGAAEQHPDVTELSDLTEGLLPPSRTADVREHLDDCELCADVLASLTEIRDLLGTLPGPPQMPADVAGRIDAALAAEALLDATRPEEREPDPEPLTSTTEPRVGPRVSRETTQGPSAADASGAGSADTAVPAGASVLGSPEEAPSPAPTPAPAGPDRPAGHPRAASGPGRRPGAPRRRRRRVAGAVFGAVATVAAIGLGALLLQPGGDHNQDPGTTSASGSAEPRTFSGGALDDQVASLLAQGDRAEPEASKPFSTESSQRTPRTNSPMRGEGPTVPKCVSLGIGKNAPPLAAKKGTYQGKGAYLVVLPDASDASRVTAYIVDASCTEKTPSGKGEVLLTHTYPRS